MFDQPKILPPIIPDPMSTFRLARTKVLLEITEKTQLLKIPVELIIVWPSAHYLTERTRI